MGNGSGELVFGEVRSDCPDGTDISPYWEKRPLFSGHGGWMEVLWLPCTRTRLSAVLGCGKADPGSGCSSGCLTCAVRASTIWAYRFPGEFLIASDWRFDVSDHALWIRKAKTFDPSLVRIDRVCTVFEYACSSVPRRTMPYASLHGSVSQKNRAEGKSLPNGKPIQEAPHHRPGQGSQGF